MWFNITENLPIQTCLDLNTYIQEEGIFSQEIEATIKMRSTLAKKELGNLILDKIRELDN